MKTLFLLSIPFLLFSCKNTAPAKSDTKSVTEQASSSVHKIELNRNYTPSKEFSRFNVNSWEVNGNILTVKVSFSGGCEEDSFKAYYTGAWMKSLPPKMDIYVEHHTPKPDFCKALVQKTIEIDISEVKYEGQNKVILRAPNGKHEAFYEYGK